MKNFIFVFITMFAVSSMAADSKTKPKPISQKICDALQTKLDEDCAHIMCDDDIANGIFKDLDDCTSSNDYAEAAQGGCDDQPTLEDMVKKYNKAHPKAKIKCE